MSKCCAPNCVNSLKNDSSFLGFFEFPDNQVERELWINKIGRANWTPGRRSIVCSAHFEKCFLEGSGRKMKLKRGALPSLFPALKKRRIHKEQKLKESKGFDQLLDSCNQDISVDGNGLLSVAQADVKEDVVFTLPKKQDNESVREMMVSEKFFDELVLGDGSFLLENGTVEKFDQASTNLDDIAIMQTESSSSENFNLRHCQVQAQNSSPMENVIIVKSASNVNLRSETLVVADSDHCASDNVVFIQEESLEAESKGTINQSESLYYEEGNSKQFSDIVSYPKFKTSAVSGVEEMQLLYGHQTASNEQSPDEATSIDELEYIPEKHFEDTSFEIEENMPLSSTLSIKPGVVHLPISLTAYLLQKHEKMHNNSVKWQIGTFMCRLCGVASNKTLNLFSDGAKGVKLLERISSVLPITIEKNDDLPQSACNKCVSQIDQCSEFITSSLNTHAYLSSVMGQDREQSLQFPLFYHKEETTSTQMNKKRHILMMDLCHEDDKSLEDLFLMAYHDLCVRLFPDFDGTDRKKCNLVIVPIENKYGVPLLEQVRIAAEVLTSEEDLNSASKKSDEETKSHSFSFSSAESADNQQIILWDDFDAENKCTQLEPVNTLDIEQSEVQAMPVYNDGSPGEFDSLKMRSPMTEWFWFGKSISFETMQNVMLWRLCKDGEVKLVCRLCKGIMEKECNILSHLRSHTNVLNCQKHSAITPCNAEDGSFPHNRYVQRYDLKFRENVPQPSQILIKRHFRTKKQFCLWYQCAFCNARYKSKPDLKYHLQQNHAANIKCCGCGFEAVDMKDATSHHQMCTDKREKEWRCQRCLEVFRTEMALQKHKNNSGHSEQKLCFSCDVCGKKYSQAAKLKHHKKTHLPPEFKYIHQCPHCPKRYVTSSRLREHMEKHEEKKYMCEVCGKLFGTKQILHQHESTHGDPQFLCALCSRTFFRKSHLLKHMNVHDPSNSRASRTLPQSHRDGLNRCRECKKVFDSKDLLYHYKTTHPHVALHNYTCEVCKEENTSYAELFQHQREAHKSGVKDCPFCGKTIDGSTQMKYHLMRHEGMFPYNCPQCNKGYTANSLLQDHIRRKHTGEKPFQCQQCSKRFPTNGALLQHSSVHSLPHQLLPCPVCNQGFKRKAHLDVHLRTHTGEKPYPCPICDRPFRQRPDCVKHVRVIHGQDPSQYNIRFHPNVSASFPQVVSVADMQLVLEGEDLMQASLEPNEPLLSQ